MSRPFGGNLVCKHKAVTMRLGEEQDVPPMWPSVCPKPSLMSGRRNPHVRLDLSGSVAFSQGLRTNHPSEVSRSSGVPTLGFSKPRRPGPSPLGRSLELVIELCPCARFQPLVCVRMCVCTLIEHTLFRSQICQALGPGPFPRDKGLRWPRAPRSQTRRAQAGRVVTNGLENQRVFLLDLSSPQTLISRGARRCL